MAILSSGTEHGSGRACRDLRETTDTTVEETIIRVLQGRAGPEERSVLQAWRRASPDNERTYREIEAVWSNLHESQVDASPPAVERVISNAGARRPRASRRSARSRSVAWRVAAAAVLLLALTEYAQWGLFGGDEMRGTPVLELVTAGESRLEQLPDGTLVHLAPESRLRVMPVDGRREVWLEGRAFFAVVTDPELPFRVRSAAGAAEVLGTRFEFSAGRREARVLVVDGRVAFAGSDERVEVGASELVQNVTDRPLEVREVEDVEALLRWMGPSFAFHNTPLEQAAREIEARFGATIRIADERLRVQTISGGFHDRSFGQIVSTICRVLDASCEIGERHAVISENRSAVTAAGIP